MQFVKVLKKLMSGISLICGIALLLGIFSVYISPDRFTFPAFFGLAFPVVYGLNIIMAIFALANKKKWVIFHIFLLLIGIPRIVDFINIIPGKHVESADQIKVLSFNVRGFNRYDWIEDKTVPLKIENFIKEEDPDIIFFQEFHLPGRDDQKAIRNFGKRLGLKYFIFNNYKATNDISGLVIFSRFPLKIVKRENFHQEIFGGNGVIIADVKVREKHLRLINMHLESIRFERPDYEYAANPTDKKFEFKIAGARIFQRFHKAYALRGEQVEKIISEIDKSKYPVILAGDANDPPISYTYYHLSQRLKDSFNCGPIGTGGTYAGRLPSFRIDYIMHSEKLGTQSHKVYREKLSDHYPVVAEISLDNI